MGCLKRTSSPSSDRPEQGWSCDQPTRHHRSNCEQPQVPNESDFISVNETTKAKFHPGQIVATPGALEALQNAGQTPHEFLVRHLSGDWGDLDQEDRSLNDAAVIDGSRILSAYTTRKGERLWIITEASDDQGRCLCTTILLASQY